MCSKNKRLTVGVQSSTLWVVFDPRSTAKVNRFQHASICSVLRKKRCRPTELKNGYLNIHTRIEKNDKEKKVGTGERGAESTGLDH